MEYDASSIQVVTQALAVRERPGMYLGDVETARGAEHAVDELLSNVVDQFLAGQATRVSVSLNAPFVEIRDDGPGLPFEVTQDGVCLAQLLLEQLHVTPSALGHAPHIHLHSGGGVGLAPVVALSAAFHATSWVQGRLWSISYRDGVLEEGPRVVEHGEGRGTCVRCALCPELLGVVMPRRGVVRRRLWEMVHLFPGLSAQMGEETFVAPQGLADLAMLHEESTTEATHAWAGRPAFRFHHEDDTMLVEAAAVGFGDKTRWRTWVNGRLTPLHGMHQEVFAQELDTMSWTPGVAMLHLVAREPQFANPVKDRLEDARADGLGVLLREALRRYCVAHEVGERVG